MAFNLNNIDIRALRESLGKSQAVFARYFQVHQTTLHAWETKGIPKRRSSQLMIRRGLRRLRASAKHNGQTDSGVTAAHNKNEQS